MSEAERWWLPDDDPHVARVEAAFTSAGSAFLYRVQVDAFARLGLPALPAEQVRAAYHTDALPDLGLTVMAKADRAAGMSRAKRLFDDLTRRRIGTTVRDARALADAVTSRWWGEGRIESEAQTAALKGFLVGRVHAGLMNPERRAANLKAAMGDIVGPDPGGHHTAAYARERAGELVTNFREEARKALALTVLDYEVQPSTPFRLAQTLGDQFATLNRDWRRVALTETATNRAHGFLAGLEEGEEVEFSAERDACQYCRRYHGRVFTVVAEPDEERFHEVVWVGKTNRGRSFHPRKIDGSLRTPDELAGPTIAAHPHCRCRWLRRAKRDPRVDPGVQAYLDHLLTL